MVSALSDLPARQVYQSPSSGLSISYRHQRPTAATITKPALVFLHGFNGNSTSWAYQFAYFTDFPIIAIDAPGFGKTSVFDGGMAGFADEVIPMLAALQAQPFFLVGHSMGGMLAQIIAARSSAECSGLILSCTHKGRGWPLHKPLSAEVKERIKQRCAMTDEDYGKLRIDRMLPGRLPTDIHHFLASIAGDIRIEGITWGGAAIQYLDTTPYLKQINTPIVIVTAANDVVVKSDAVDALIAGLPNAAHIEMKGVGHAPYCEDADSFNAIVAKFIRQHLPPNNLPHECP